ncbi:MAG: CpaF family protein [Candidatus Micrarchaeia archaeon]
MGNNGLGWTLEKDAEYKIGMRLLSNAEIDVVLSVCKEFGDVIKDEVIENGDTVRKILRNTLLRHLSTNKIDADDEQIEYLTETLYLTVYAYGPLTEMLENDSLEEIAVIGLNKPVYVYDRVKGWMETNVKFTDRNVLIDIINKMGRKIGRRVTIQNPRLNAVLPDGSRIHATIEPVSELELTIRKFKKVPLTIRDLVKTGYSYELLAFLWVVFQNDKNVIICGNTAAGKTTVLNALFSFVPANERIVLLEETPEISIPHKHQLKMKTTASMNITMKDLIEDSLRMRPDRVIIGEVRTKDEILAMIESMNAGQARGCYATMHANSAKELISRLKYNDVIPSDINSIDLIIVQRRFLRFENGPKMQEMRRVIEVCEPMENKGTVIIKHLFKYDPKTDCAVMTPAKSKIIEEIAAANNMSYEEVMLEVGKRAKYLRNNLTKNSNIADVIEKYGAVG